MDGDVGHAGQSEDDLVPDKGSHGVVSVGQLVIAWIESDDGSLTIVPAVPNDRSGLVTPAEFDDVDMKVDGILSVLEERRPPLRADKGTARNVAGVVSTSRKANR